MRRQFFAIFAILTMPAWSATPLCDSDGYVNLVHIHQKAYTRHIKPTAPSIDVPALPAFKPSDLIGLDTKELEKFVRSRQVSRGGAGGAVVFGGGAPRDVRLGTGSLQYGIFESGSVSNPTRAEQNAFIRKNWVMRPVYPEVPKTDAPQSRDLIIDGKRMKLPFDTPAAKSCKDAVNAVIQSDINRQDKSKLTAGAACALLNYDQQCLSTEPPPMVNLPVAERSIVALTQNGEAWCMGVLDYDGTKSYLITARHCFVDPITGSAYEFLRLRSGETLDRKRSLKIDDATAADLALGKSFSASSDAVRIPVEVAAAPDASTLPKLQWAIDVPKDSTVWVPGAVTDLLEALELKALVENGVSSALNWRQSIRWGKWLNGDSRITLTEDGCRYYTAQVWRGFSGAPVVLSVSANTMVVAGVHSGAAGLADEAAWEPCGSSKEARIFALTQNLGDAEIDP